MQFKIVHINSFMSYQSVSIDLDEFKNLTLIEGVNDDEGGSNGSGKSTLWDAISWCLFGQTVRGLKNDEVVNRKFGKDCSVSLSFSYGGVEYEVTRCRKHSELKNRLYIQDTHRIIELGTMALTQEWMDERFSLDFDLFRCTVIFAQGETFNFVNAGNKRQKEILSKVMKIDFDVPLKNARERKNQLEDSKSKTMADIATLQSHVKENPEEDYREEIRKWAVERSHRMQGLDLDNGAVESELSSLEKSLKELSDRSTDDVLIELKEKLAALKAVERKILDKIAEAKADFRAGERDLKKLDAAIELGVCDNCGQETTGEVLRAKRHSLGNELMAPQLLILELEEKIQRLEFAIEDVDQKIEKVRSIRKERMDAEVSVGRLRERLETGRRRYQDIVENTVNPFQELLMKEIVRQKAIQEKIVGCNEELERISDQLIYINFWVEAFGDGGIKSFIFDLIASDLSERSNTYVNILTNGQVSVRFDTQTALKSGDVREKFECAVISDGKKVRYEAYSGGEKRKISLAVDVALTDIAADYHGSYYNLVVFDEQTNFLDKQGRDSFYNLLRELSKDRKVFVVDHDSEFRSKFDNVMTVRKRGGVSVIDG